MYNEYEIRPIPLSVPHCRRQVVGFLEKNGLRLDEVDYYACVFKMGNDEEILAGGGLCGDIIKCIAVDSQLREEGFSNRLVSHLISEADSRGHHSVKVFTKPENKTIFESMGFHLIAQAPKAILMENGEGLKNYCQYLTSLAQPAASSRSNSQPTTTSPSLLNGAIVMNANPFTRGHRYLIEQASRLVKHLFVIVVGEDKSEFPYPERLAMVQKGTADLGNVTACEGSSYAISSATFPTYFLKQINDATDTQILLDLDLFMRAIAPAINAKVRFIGTEPTDCLTKRYNELIRETLPGQGCQVVEIERFKMGQHAVSASAVRQLLHDSDISTAASYVHPTTIPYLLAHLASNALLAELDTTPKPGLVDRHDNGAHKDMDYDLMRKSIQTLRPYFVRLAEVGRGNTATDRASMETTVAVMKAIGIEAEQAMLTVTNGVNTHKGALFALGLTTVAAAQLLQAEGRITHEKLQAGISRLALRFPPTSGTHGATVMEKHHIGGALAQAQQGYPRLFDQWLPYYRRHHGNPYQHHLVLLHIMATLDDTNIVYRKGPEVAQQVKDQARQLGERFTLRGLRQMNEAFITNHISPGGCADMLAQTIFIHQLTLNK